MGSFHISNTDPGEHRGRRLTRRMRSGSNRPGRLALAQGLEDLSAGIEAAADGAEALDDGAQALDEGAEVAAAISGAVLKRLQDT